MFALAYIVGGIYTVKEFVWYEDLRYVTLQELGMIALIFAIWPIARAYWGIIR